jgi:hypothetical protein
VVRGLQLGDATRRAAAGTTSSTGGADWWGVGPGAHSHVGGVRWWNVKHPRIAPTPPTAGRSSAEDQRVERLLELRLADGLPQDVLDAPGAAAVPRLVSSGLLTAAALDETRGRCSPTRVAP